MKIEFELKTESKEKAVKGLKEFIAHSEEMVGKYEAALEAVRATGDKELIEAASPYLINKINEHMYMNVRTRLLLFENGVNPGA